MESFSLSDSILSLHGIGPTKAKYFAGLGIFTIGDLLTYYPRDYQDRREILSVANLSHGDRVSCVVYVTGEPVVYRKNRIQTITRVKAADDTGAVTLVFFNQDYRARQLHKGMRLLCFGTVNMKFQSRDIVPEDLRILDEDEEPKGALIPVYRSCMNLSGREIGKTIRSVLENSSFSLPEVLPENIIKKYRLLDRTSAVRAVHNPENEDCLKAARRRLVFEELFVFSIGLTFLKKNKQQKSGIAMQTVDMTPFYANLSYQPTSAQRRAINEALVDLTKAEHPMNRLLQGDVGSGKTTVAAACCYFTACNGLQSAVMAPTELLAIQHFQTFTKLLSPLGISCGLLTGSTPLKKRKTVLDECKLGKLRVLIGTHALLEEQVQFKNLAFTLCDEQQRFGVRQRNALLHSANAIPHNLVMSATPIPRTLALIMYGDMDISVLDEMPPGRKTISTYLVGENMRQRIYDFIRREANAGHRAYIVCPLIENKVTEDGEIVTDLKPVTEYYSRLAEDVFPDLKIGFLHGKMKNDEKDRVMSDFREGNIQILVSTTVIEVGVDVPEATVMIVENAERFGLSQLHQLRGRVGRGKAASYCILLSNGSEISRQRLEVLCKTNDGFEISKRDLELRGPGDFFGARQHGLPEMKIASLAEDMNVLYYAREEAENLLNADPLLSEQSHRGLAGCVKKLFAQYGNGDLFVTL